MNRRIADGKTTVDLLYLSCIAHEIKESILAVAKRLMRAADLSNKARRFIRLPSSRAAHRTLRTGYRRARAARFLRW
jgi:hypothetical protein